MSDDEDISAGQQAELEVLAARASDNAQDATVCALLAIEARLHEIADLLWDVVRHGLFENQ